RRPPKALPAGGPLAAPLRGHRAPRHQLHLRLRRHLRQLRVRGPVLLDPLHPPPARAPPPTTTRPTTTRTKTSSRPPTTTTPPPRRSRAGWPSPRKMASTPAATRS